MAQGEGLNKPELPSADLLQRWIQKQADLLIAERKIEQDESRLLLSKCPPKQLERNGVAILGLGVQSTSVGLGGKTLIELERPAAFHSIPAFPPHSLRPGDIVQLEDHDYDPSSQGKGGKGKASTAEQAVSGVVYRVMESKIVIAAASSRKGNNNDGAEVDELPNRIRVVKVANEATFNRMEHFLVRLSKMLRVTVKTSRKVNDNASSSSSESETEGEASSKTASSSYTSATPLVSALLALQSPTWSRPEQGEGLPMPLINTGLNSSQLAAINFALRANQFALIHGPPGTGKTTTVAELVLQLAIGLKKRVLVCGASNLAADNLLERIVVKGAESLAANNVGVTRIGHPARVLKSLITRTLDYQAQNSDEGSLIKDVRQELEAALASLRPKEAAAGNKSTSSRGQASAKGKLKGSERKERRAEIKLLRKEYRKRESGLLKTVLKKADIVVATCHGAGGRQLDGAEFDVVVIDEACQATEASCWIPILRAKADGKVILAGDHLQLPPTVKGFRHSQLRKKREGKPKQKEKKGSGKKSDDKASVGDGDKKTPDGGDDAGEEQDDDEEEDTLAAFSRLSTGPKKTTLRPPRSLETTMFSRLLGLYGPACKALLDRQYRMNTEIMRFPNESLYEGKIEADASCASIRLVDLEGFHPSSSESKTGENSSSPSDDDDDDELFNAPIVFYDTAGSEMYESKAVEDGTGNQFFVQSDSKCNANEVTIVSRHVEMLIKMGLSPSHISILSPYNLQVRLISDHLRSLRDPLFETIIVGSIDSMQGMENEVILLSLVRSNDQREVGFLAEKKRLNVAMTRAKRQLCVIGDSGTIGDAKDEYLSAWMSFLEDHALVEPVVD